MGQMDIGDVIMDAVMDVLKERLDDKTLRKIDTQPIRKKLSKRIFDLLFYELLTEGSVKLPPGLGSLRTLEVKKTVAKVYDRKRGVMVERPVSRRKILYKPGDTIREFL